MAICQNIKCQIKRSDSSIMFPKGLDSSRQVESLKKKTKLLSLKDMFQHSVIVDSRKVVL